MNFSEWRNNWKCFQSNFPKEDTHLPGKCFAQINVVGRMHFELLLLLLLCCCCFSIIVFDWSNFVGPLTHFKGISIGKYGKQHQHRTLDSKSISPSSAHPPPVVKTSQVNSRASQEKTIKTSLVISMAVAMKYVCCMWSPLAAITGESLPFQWLHKYLLENFIQGRRFKWLFNDLARATGQR